MADPRASRPKPFDRHQSHQMIETVIGPVQFGRFGPVAICFFDRNRMRPVDCIEHGDRLAIVEMTIHPDLALACCRAANDLWAHFLMSHRFGGRVGA